MKKSLWSLLTLVMAFALVVSGCGTSGNNAEQGGNEAEGGGSAESYSYLMATGGTGGTYYPLGGSIAQVWSDNIENVEVTVQSTGASVENMRLLGSGETELAMAINAIAESAYNGKGEFEGNAITNFGAIGVVYPEVIQIVTPKDSGIKSIKDLAGKRVSLGPAGSGTAVAAEQILEAYGLTKNDVQAFQDTFSDAATKIKDGNLDAAFAILSVPAGNIEDIASTKEVNLISVEGDGLAALQEKYPFFATYTVPAGTYNGQDADVQTVAQQAVMYVLNDVPEDVVYEMTKNMYEKKDDIAKGHASGNQIELEKALDGVTTPLHPGAEKYFKEKGLK